jgi:hypothetical protein
VNNFSLFEGTSHFHAKCEQYFFVEGKPFIHSQIAKKHSTNTFKDGPRASSVMEMRRWWM